jgi:hypothetical protein
MPRLAPDGPQLLASPDGAHVALVHEGRLELHAAATRALAATATLGGAGPIDIGFSSLAATA